MTNVFPEHTDTPVARLQPEGVLRYQSVPPILPAYNKFMGGVDRTNQRSRTYGFDRNSKHYWLRIFFQFFDYAIYQQCLSALQAQLSCSQIECKGFARFSARVGAPALRTSWA